MSEFFKSLVLHTTRILRKYAGYTQYPSFSENASTLRVVEVRMPGLLTCHLQVADRPVLPKVKISGMTNSPRLVM